MTETDTPAARAAAARAVLRLLARLARRPASGRPPTTSADDAAVFALSRQRGWVEADSDRGEWRISEKGREFLRRAMSGQDLPEASAAAEHRFGRAATTHARDGEVEERASNGVQPSAGIDADESPLAWLRRRKGRDGEPLISADEFQAGERLRADFWFAGMTPRVTSRWGEGPSTGGRRSAPGAGVEVRDAVIAAEARVRRALKAVGPELCGVLIDVCCHLKGIEDAERQAGWPQRAGKIVLRIALAQLARHYGIGVAAVARDGPARTRHWGAADYRPRLDGEAG